MKKPQPLKNLEVNNKPELVKPGIKPVDLDKAGEPVNPTETIKVGEPVKPTETVKENEPVKTTETVKTDEPLGPKETIKTDEPIEATKAVKENEPVKATETIKTDEPLGPKETIKTDEPLGPKETIKTDEPIEATKAVKVDELMKPTKTIKTEQQVIPTETVKKDEPAKSTPPLAKDEQIQPTKAAKADESIKATETIKTDEPIEPTKAVKVDESIKPTETVMEGEPAKPTEPLVKDEPIEPTKAVTKDEPIKKAEPTTAFQLIMKEGEQKDPLPRARVPRRKKKNINKKKKGDETICRAYEPFKCPGNGACISIQYLCDGAPDCPDGYDEDSKLCTAAKRPPVEETASFLQSLLASHGPNYLEKLFGTKAREALSPVGGVKPVAIALSESQTIEDFGAALHLMRSDLEHLRSVFMAVENGDLGMLKSLGIKDSELGDVKFFLEKLVNTGFLD